ncbi:MAG: MMPL family transporter [Anaerolineae bacterium]|nr:MMPL family transporter [Anaerolineae bacterium]
MFEFIGRFAAHYRWPIIIGWIALAALVTLIAPPLEQVASSTTTDFLPASAPFVRAYALAHEHFPDQDMGGSAVIAVETPEGSSVREGAAWNYIVELTAWLMQLDGPAGITGVTSPAQGVPLLADSLIAPDDRLAIMMVDFQTGVLEDETRELLERIKAHMATLETDGFQVYLTGNSPIFSGYATGALESVDRTLGVTIVLVVLLLLLVYRSPVSPLLPLLTVTIAYLISRGIVGWLGANVLTITIYANVMMIVVLFGAGTDYCLFLISRFREEMADDDQAAEATIRTVHRVGETITSSAGTVIVGFVAMIFAEMGLFNTTGPALAISVVVMLLTGLTLTPALLATLGARAFWPGKAHHRGDSRLYEWVSLRVSEHPVQAILLLVAVLGPLALYATGQRTTYNMLSDLVATNEARRGFEALERHMGGGTIQPLTVVVAGLDPDSALAEIDRWTQTLLALDGVADVRSLSAPLGRDSGLLTNIASVRAQFGAAASLLAEAGEGGLPADALTPQNLQLALSLLPTVAAYLDAVQERAPALAENADMQGLRQTLAGLPVAALTGRISPALETLQAHLAALAASPDLEGVYYLPDELPAELSAAIAGASAGLDTEGLLDSFLGRYLSADRTAARFEVIPRDNPYGDEVTTLVHTLRDMLPGGEAAVSGVPVVTTDLRDTMERDMLRSFSLVLLGILIVLVVLLRALISPLYLILTILLSYGATMGITRLFSSLVFGVDALTWWVPFFMFSMLIALGMDYNIFLMGRVKEEAAQHGMREGVHRAVAATGPIITSAGLIMAGTFAAMLAGSVTGLKQLGFAVAVGVLLDTFVIRTALVPAIAVLLDRWNWWPGKAPRVPAGRKAGASHAPASGDR